MKKNLIYPVIFPAILLMLVLVFTLTSRGFAQTPSPSPVSSPKSPKLNNEKFNQLLDQLSTARSFIEFYFMESGEYPETFSDLLQELNSVLQENQLTLLEEPKDPATGKPFIYERNSDKKGYTLKVPDPSAYGLDKLEVGSAPWKGYTIIAEDRKVKLLYQICLENINFIATALEYYAKDNKKYPDKLKELIPRYLKTMPLCPATGEMFLYEVKGDNYEIRVPNPKAYKAEVFLFSTERGLVVK